MELDKLRAELRPQSPEERRERLREEVDEGDETEPVKTPRRSRDELLREAAEAEKAVLERLAEIAPPLYEFESQVVVREGLFLDGLLISQIDQLSDLVVEIKYVPTRLVEIARRVREARLQLREALSRYGRPAGGWLIVVVGEKPDPRESERLEGMVREEATGIRLSFVTLDDLQQLRLPI
jgi:hypothetical protein